MSVSVGIPRALLYYDYFPLWQGFFKSLGADVVVSDITCKRIVSHGLRESVDDACLPVKVYFGHVLDLSSKVDYIFVPRLVSVEERAYICPKFMGLPDMVRSLLRYDDKVRIIDTCIDMSKGKRVTDGVLNAGRVFTSNPIKIWNAFFRGYHAQKNYRRAVLNGHIPYKKRPLQHNRSKLSIGLLGHPYNIYDPYITMDLIGVLWDMGVSVLTPEMVPEKAIQRQAKRRNRKELFWTLGKRTLGATGYFQESGKVDGIIHVASFGCGPNSLVAELLSRDIRRDSNMPYIELNIDEHSGQAGIITRLEAFIDMIRWRNERT